MEPATILAALITGATIAMKDTAEQAIKDAYSGLRTLITSKFSVGSVTMLEKDPNDEEFRKSVEKEIGLTPELLSDPEVKQLIVKLYNTIEGSVSEAELQSIGVDIRVIRSKRDSIVKGVSGFDQGVRSELVESGQDTVIEGISGKPRT